ncbi:ABC transporter permease [Maritalea mediterranea]|uniref:ABC transporter permease subunit n=1 Tax=Maritalea mediterranea TaxID=2909667 RepID=A0ABS9E3L0_9HYPH|nr:ABC transporter permease subunit [Maritalea mediterranea]MCF4097452.1 ABC transporter permease subunit [Maritalea mediterranea]
MTMINRALNFLFWAAPALVILLLMGPLLAGLLGVGAPALGYFPALGGVELTVDYLHKALHVPGFWHSVHLSIWIGLATTLISFVIVIGFFAAFWDAPLFGKITRFVSPLMSVPHAAAAFGFAFLFAPSGWLIRLLSPWATGFDRPPDWLIINDPLGYALLAGLVLKEIPFLFLMSLSAASQINVDQRLKLARSLGYGRIWAWITVVMPALYRQIRLPIFAVIAFSSSVVDVALILGPNLPPSLPVQILRWMNDPDIEMRFVAAAGAVFQLGATLFALLVWRFLEIVCSYLMRQMQAKGMRHQNDGAVRALFSLAMLTIVLISLASLIILGIWSLAGYWRFPEALPRTLGLNRWMDNASYLWGPTLNAVNIGVAATLISVGLTLICLENECRHNIRLTQKALRLIYLPLIVPQIAFISGISILLVRYGLDGSFWPVTLMHVVFVFPYTYLALEASFHDLDPRYMQTATALGKSQNRIFFHIKLPMLLRPILTALALGFTISVAQYIPTLLIGAGRVPTITTEAVALASGGDRRLIGIYALVQTLLPAIGFVLALALPKLLYPNKIYFAKQQER